MHISKFIPIFFIIFLAIPLIINIPIHPVYALTKSVSIIDSIDGTSYSNFTTAQKHVGDKFTVNVALLNGNLTGWQVGMRWDNSLLNYVSISVPPITGNIFPIVAGPDTSVPGLVVYGAVMPPGYSAFVGSCTMCQLTLEIMKAPANGQSVTSSITFEDIGLDTFLLYGVQDISSSYIWNNGSYKYAAPSSVSIINSVDGTSYSNFTTVQKHVGDKFTVNVTLLNGNLSAWQVSIQWDSSLLSYVDISIPSDNIFASSSFITAGPETSVDGIVVFAAALTPQNWTAVVGSGTMCQLTLEIMKAPANGQSVTSSITFEGIDSDTFIFYESISWSDVTSDYAWNNGSYRYATVPSPQYSNISVSSTIAGKPCVFSCEWVDASGLSDYIFGTNNTGSWVNETWTLFNHISAWANVTEVLTLPIGTVVSFEWWCNDSVNNWNNTGIQSITLVGVHDVAVMSVTMPFSSAYQGWVVNITVTVANLGNAIENFTTTIAYDNNTIGAQSVMNLAPDTQLTLLFSWNTTNVSCSYVHNYTITATASTVPGESNASNNQLNGGQIQIRKMGDVNGDEAVNMKDVAAAILAFNTWLGKSRWNPDCDLDLNGIVNMRDIVIIVMNFNLS